MTKKKTKKQKKKNRTTNQVTYLAKTTFGKMKLIRLKLLKNRLFVEAPNMNHKSTLTFDLERDFGPKNHANHNHSLVRTDMWKIKKNTMADDWETWTDK